MFFKQCLLRKGPKRMMSWLPALFAKVGKVLKLRNTIQSGCLVDHGAWDDGWIVMEVYGGEEERELEERSRDHLLTRKASDWMRGWRNRKPRRS